MKIMTVRTLGDCQFASPLRHPVDDNILVPLHIEWPHGISPEDQELFERAGPRARLFFDPREVRAGMVTCGGLCPGLNNVIRSLFLELHHRYGVKEILGFRDGYLGPDSSSGRTRSSATSSRGMRSTRRWRARPA